MTTTTTEPTVLHFTGADRETGEAHELTGTLAEGVAYAVEYGVDLKGYLSDDAETQLAQGVALTVKADGNYRWH